MTTQRHRRITHPAGDCLQAVSPTMSQRAAHTQRAKGTPNARSNRPFPHASPAQAATKVVAFTVAKQHTPATISFINNQGDLSKTLEQLGSENNLKSIATTMLTAGAIHGLGGQISLDVPDTNGTLIATRLNDIKVGSGWTPNLAKNLINATTSATLNTAINRGDWGANLSHGLTSGLIDTVAQQGAYAIGNATTGQNHQPPTLDSTGNTLAHFALGCAVGSASAGSVNGCAPGAIGAVVGENTAEYAKTHNLSNADALALAKVLAGTSGLLTGGMDNAGAVNIAVMTGGNAAENNYLNHIRPSTPRLSEKERYDAAAAACATGDQGACGTRNELTNLSRQRDQQLAQACSGVTPDLCNSLAKDAASMGNVIHGNQGGLVYANSPAPSPLNVATIGAPNRPDNFHDQLAQSTVEAAIQEVGGAAIGGVISAGLKYGKSASTAVRELFASKGVMLTADEAVRIGSRFGANGGVVAGGKAVTGEATAIAPLDWSIIGKTGETRAAHINAQHGNLNLQKPSQGVFYGDPIAVTNDAWAIAQTQGIKPITANGVDMYVIPRPNSGYAGGYKGVGDNLNSVTILTEPGTSKMITSYPGNGTPLPKAP